MNKSFMSVSISHKRYIYPRYKSVRQLGPMSSFPASKYTRYKRATAFFLDWLLRARNNGRHAGQVMKLALLNDVVTAIAEEPSILTPKLLRDFPKALAACQCAITLRERVAAFFADDEQGHQHFLERLRIWLQVLKGVEVKAEETTGPQTDTVDTTKFENYYEVLEVDEDFFPDEGTYVAEATSPTCFKADRQRLLEEAFAEDLRLEVVYFFVELEELSDGVFDVFDQVKKEQRTMVEATVVAKLAIDTAKALTAVMQLQHPSLQTALDVFAVAEQKDPELLRSRMADALTTTWKDFAKDGVYKRIPGMFMAEFVAVGTTLEVFAPMIPPTLQYRIALPADIFGESYSEDRTPHSVLPDPSSTVMFLMQQLPELYNTITYSKVTTFKSYDTTEVPDWRLVGTFMTVMEKYFTSREISVSAVFACMCWLKSVTALQGNGDLIRNVDFTLDHTTNLLTRIEATVAKGAVKAEDEELHEFLVSYASEIKRSSQMHHLLPTNPLIAGFLMVEHHFEYMDLASEAVETKVKFYTFGHLYNALVNEGYLNRVPFLEDILDTYKQMIFIPSRAAARHGAYYRTFLLSSNLKATMLDAVARSESIPTGSNITKPRPKLLLRDLSKIFRLMTMDDKSFLSGVSSRALLNRALDICSSELFETRVLSRDMLMLFDDITDVYSELFNTVGRRVKDEGSLTIVLLRWLDAMKPNGELDASLLPRGNLFRLSGYTNGEAVKFMCSKIAAVIKSRFASSKSTCEKYFMVPRRLDGTNLEGKEETIVNTDDMLNDEMNNCNKNNGGASKKRKKNKKKNRKSSAKSGAPTTIVHDEGTECSETLTMLNELLGSAGSKFGRNSDNTSVTCLEATVLKSVSAIFSRLRNINVAAFHKAEDVRNACNVIQKVQRLVEENSGSDSNTTATLHKRTTLFAVASHVIQLMHKFYRIDNKAIRVPALERVRDLCGLTVVFAEFAVGTARIGMSIDKTPQVREVLDPFEKRLVNMPFRLRHLWGYRQLVQKYSKARYDMGLNQTSSVESFRALEWYLTNSISDPALQSALDGMDGFPLYFDLVVNTFQDTADFEKTINELAWITCYGDFVKHVVYGCSIKKGIDLAHNVVVTLAESYGVHLCELSSKHFTSAIHVGEFKFSAAGIIRDTA